MRVAFLANVCIVSDQTSEAGNVKYCPQLHARRGLRFIIRFQVAPTEVRCEFLKSSFFVVAVFLWSNRVMIRINMHREATRNPHMVPWGWGEGRKKYFFLSLIFYEKNISI